MLRGRPIQSFVLGNVSLEEKLKNIGFVALPHILTELFNKAAQENLSHKDFLTLVVDREITLRHDRKVERLIRQARFQVIKTIDTFDWTHPTSIPKSMILNFINLDFIEEKEHLIFLGPGGVGKTHLAKAIGFAACQKEIPTLFTTVADMINDLVAAQADHSLKRALMKYTRPRLAVLDELGYLPLDEQGRSLFFQVVSKRAETGSMIITTNKPFKDWGQTFHDAGIASAIAERLTEHGELIKIEGSSYRVTKRRQKQLGLDGIEKA
jgi:DNA replication protein DnaC